MVWQDLIINRKLFKKEVLEAFTYTFKVIESEILIIKGIEELISIIDNSVKIIIQPSILERGSMMILSVFIRDDDLIPEIDTVKVGEICEILNCKILISDSSIAPYTMIEVQGKNRSKQVTVELDDFENVVGYDLL